MLLESILGIIITSVLRKSLQTREVLPRWDKVLVVGFIFSIVLMMLSMFLPDSQFIVKWIGHLLVFYLVYIVLSHEALKYGKPLIYSLLPLIIFSFITDVTEVVFPVWFSKVDTYFDSAILFSYLWILAFWFVTKRQRKALEAERVRTLEIEKQNKLNEQLNAVLEVQVAERTALLTSQKAELEKAIKELKSAQALLIQSEKMASLGELTAGIAHEIQNPLNFINNFSEINAELLDELKHAVETGNKEEAITLANDAKENQVKIKQHGQRADSIVKGMLQHSRSSNGQKEPTDINALCSEYLRLAYHGLRAKDKSFNAEMIVDLDDTVGKVSVVPQDIGRVILNIISNAFYAAASYSRKVMQDTGQKRTPTLWLHTKKTGNTLVIAIRDNGPGIQQSLIDKIFQPFFTTKPTGEGTGLGLSLSYEIVKAHGGEIKINTTTVEGAGPGEEDHLTTSAGNTGTEFMIILPT